MIVHDQIKFSKNPNNLMLSKVFRNLNKIYFIFLVYYLGVKVIKPSNKDIEKYKKYHKSKILFLVFGRNVDVDLTLFIKKK